jgi:predicted acylesterase/phospholipase RssA
MPAPIVIPPPAVAPRALRLRFHTLGTGLAYLYVLRVPIITWAVLFALPIVAIPRHAALGSLLRGLFDIGDSNPSETYQLLPFALLTFTMLMASATIAVTANLIAWDGGRRFEIDPLPPSRGIRLLLRVVPAIAAIAVIWGAWSQSGKDVGVWNSLGGIGIGIVVFVLVMRVTHEWLWDQLFSPKAMPGASRNYLVIVANALSIAFRWLVRLTPEGFVDAQYRLWARHAFALLQFFFSLVLYVGLFIMKSDWSEITKYGTLAMSRPPRVPTLCLVLVLAMLLCWVLTALTFVFDRYRVPLLTLLFAYGSAVSVFPQGDHFFQSSARDSTKAPAVAPEKVLQRRANLPVIVVAATGGGIQAAAWTARVIAGLQHDAVNCKNPDFDAALVAMSTVSGGSMGAMFIADAYQKGKARSATAFDDALESAEASSLDDVAWALTYPDLLWTVAPFLKGAGLRPLHLVNGPYLVKDRASALEDTWRDRSSSLKDATLDQWRLDLAKGERPAVLFNSTIAETGERMLLSTTTLGADGPGRREFAIDYADRDIAVATAARLSASFPYVSPPARIDRQGVFADEYHFVDGGYYDNYGTATAVEWLDKGLGLAGGQKPSRVLLLQIRSSPSDGPDQPDGRRGWSFETAQPLETLYQVRGTGQLAQSDWNVNLFKAYRSGFVSAVTIEFPKRLADEEDDKAPPLSWHLTADDRRRLKMAWKDDPNVFRSRVAVHGFLNPKDVDNASRCVAP